MINLAIEALIDFDALAMLPLADHGDEAPRLGLHDLADHAVLDAERALVAQEHDLVADGEAALAILRPKRVSFLEETSLDELAARQSIEGTDIAAQMREDQRGLRGIVVPVPVRDQVPDRLGLELGAENAALVAIGREGNGDAPTRKIERRVPHPLFALAVDGLELGIADALGDRPERRARLDRLKLVGVADQDEFCAGPRGGFDEGRHLPRGDHAGLVDHHHSPGVERGTAVLPAQLP